jgi:hypothetical protein
VGATVAGGCVATGAVVAGGCVATGAAVVAAGPQEVSSSEVRTSRLTTEESINFLLISFTPFAYELQSDIGRGGLAYLQKFNLLCKVR